MAKWLVLVIVAALAISLSGCGTVGITTCGMAPPVHMYFGVQADVKDGRWLDVPFSAVADTALLPLTTTTYAISVLHWWSLDEKQKLERANDCPIPWEWEKLGEKQKLNANKEVEPRSEHIPDN